MGDGSPIAHRAFEVVGRRPIVQITSLAVDEKREIICSLQSGPIENGAAERTEAGEKLAQFGHRVLGKLQPAVRRSESTWILSDRGFKLRSAFCDAERKHWEFFGFHVNH